MLRIRAPKGKKLYTRRPLLLANFGVLGEIEEDWTDTASFTGDFAFCTQIPQAIPGVKANERSTLENTADILVHSEFAVA